MAKHSHLTKSKPRSAQRGPQAPWRLNGGYPFIRSWGDAGRIATVCGQVSVQAVSQWKRVPRRHLNSVASLLGVPAGVLRPDIDLVRLANGTPASLLELILAWRIIQAARATLGHATQAVKEARIKRDNMAAELHAAQKQLVHDRQIFRADLLDIQSQTIERLHTDLRTAHSQVKKAERARVACYRSLIRTGIPCMFLQPNSKAECY